MTIDLRDGWFSDRAPKLNGVGAGYVAPEITPRFIALEFTTDGSTAQMVWSSDAVLWHYYDAPFGVRLLVELARGDTSWLAIYDNDINPTKHCLIRSNNGVFWEKITLPIAVKPRQYPSGITYGGGKYLFSATNDANTAVLLYSTTNGKTWAQASATITTTPMVAYGNSVYVGVGSPGVPMSGGVLHASTPGTLLTSADGATWSAETNPSGIQNTLDGNGDPAANWVKLNFLSDGKFWLAGWDITVATREGFPEQVSTSATFAYSSDGTTWTPVDTDLPYNPWDIACDNSGNYVAVLGNGRDWLGSDAGGTSAGLGKCMVSSDGVNWTVLTNMPLVTSWIAIAYGDGMFVATGNDEPPYNNEVIAYSSDAGQTWTVATNPLGLPDLIEDSDGIQQLTTVRYG